MPFYVKVTTPKEWMEGDYTDNSSYDINMTVYSDPEMQNTVDLTSFTTITMRLIDPNHNGRLVWDSTTGVSGDANGVITWQPTSGATPSLRGHFKVRPRFEDSTQKLTAKGIAGSDDIFFNYD